MVCFAWGHLESAIWCKASVLDGDPDDKVPVLDVGRNVVDDHKMIMVHATGRCVCARDFFATSMLS